MNLETSQKITVLGNKAPPKHGRNSSVALSQQFDGLDAYLQGSA